MDILPTPTSTSIIIPHASYTASALSISPYSITPRTSIYHAVPLCPAPEPKTALGRLRILVPTALIRISPLCLGAIIFGEVWEQFMGKCTKETAFEMLDFFYESGGNFVDTANNNQNEESEAWIGEWMEKSEAWIGEWMEKRGLRDQMVIATKFTTNYRSWAEGNEHPQVANYSGNCSKSMALSVEASLKKLKTT